MNIRTSILVTIAAGAAVCCTSLYAEPDAGFRINTGVYIDEGDPLIGAAYQIPVSSNAALVPGMEYVFLDNGKLLTFNLDSRFDLNANTSNPMWAGVGVGAIRREVRNFHNTDYGVNLTWGMEFNNRLNWRPYLSTKAVLSDQSYLMVGFGFSFSAPGSRSTTAPADQ